MLDSRTLLCVISNPANSTTSSPKKNLSGFSTMPFSPHVYITEQFERRFLPKNRTKARRHQYTLFYLEYPQQFHHNGVCIHYRMLYSPEGGFVAITTPGRYERGKASIVFVNRNTMISVPCIQYSFLCVRWNTTYFVKRRLRIVCFTGCIFV